MNSPTPRVLISSAKGETHDHREGFRPLYKRLRAAGYAPAKLSAAASDSAAGGTGCGITATALAGAAILVFGCPMQRFTAVELDVLRGFLNQGGSVLVCSAAGGEVRAGTNLNTLLEERGISVLPDCLLAGARDISSTQGRPEVGGERPHGLGPTEVWVSGGSPHPTAAAASTVTAGGGDWSVFDIVTGEPFKQSAELTGEPIKMKVKIEHCDWSGFVYPSGATLAVRSPAVALLTGGPGAHPANQPIAACWHVAGHGKLAVLGSAAALEGRWLRAVEGNARLADRLFQWLLPVCLPPHGSNIVVEPQIGRMSAASAAAAAAISAASTAETGPGTGLLRHSPPTPGASQLNSGVGHPPTAATAAPPTAAARVELNWSMSPERDTWAESEQLRCCVQDDGAIPTDISALLDETIFILAPTLLHGVAPLYEQLGVHQEPLSLIAPELDVPAPPLLAAVFPPVWRDLPPPPLEIFDPDSLLMSSI